MSIRVFPVAAGETAPHFDDDFTRGKHDGVDIFAAEGSPVLAVDDGELRFAEDPKGGHAFYLRASDGTVYYGAHLSAYEGTGPRSAEAGEVIGYVGHTGNAAGTSPHLHFEVHPMGGVAVDPFHLLHRTEPPVVTSIAEGARAAALPEDDGAPHEQIPVPRAPLPPPPVLEPVASSPRTGRGGAALFFGALLFGGVLLGARGR